MRFKRPEIGATLLAVLVAAYLLAVANATFWERAWRGFDSAAGFLAFAAAALVLFAAVMIGLSFRYVAKPVYIFSILSAVAAAYFTDTFGTIIDDNMLENVVSTNSGEGGEFLTPSLGLHLLVWGILPSLLIAWMRIEYGAPGRRIRFNLAASAIMGAVCAILVAAQFGQVVAAIRKDHSIMQTLNPSGPVSSAVKLAVQMFENRNAVRAPYGNDARRGGWITRASKPVVTVIVAGESARAMNFSLNGYTRQTNPMLERRDVVNFPNVTSCGTETSVSLRCMFSGYARRDFSKRKATSRESLMDVFRHAGIDAYWWDNDGGSKGVADGIRYESFMIRTDSEHCRGGTCQDDIFLDQLERKIAEVTSDTVIVLHQRGSHGPAYYLRYPDDYGPFKPDCRSEQLTDCSPEEIVNAYDNTIVYTDRFLARVIDMLDQHRQTATGAMLYISDHGESLGENGLYFHATPYASAPPEQTRVPLITWFSEDYRRMAGLDAKCLAALTSSQYSHDNIFHTLLGMMSVETSVYKAELDMFKGCRNG